ncbi:DUF418 domain-containing protein [Bradyrhizobium sp.]|uniref:DUF418 domain-containing protein n=1 Tax=Bradyrhizobium sp. TaxID=376 RepID=UPI003C7562FC
MVTMQSGSEQLQLVAASDAGPIAPSDRIAAIDIARGIALFGVMAINVVTVFRVSIFERFLPAPIDGTWLDRALHSILMIGIDLKAFALFSLLFGVGLAIQYDHLSASYRRTALLVRRLAFLLLIGAAHLVLIWNGDILFEYAIAGFVVLPFLFGPSRLPAIVGAALLAVFIISSFLPPIASMPSRSWMTNNVADAAHIYGSGGLAAVQAFRVHELPGLLPLHLFIFPRTVALMLIGAAAWRADLFRTGSRASRCLPFLAAIGVLVGGALAVTHENEWLRMGWRTEVLVERLGTVLLACGYGAAIIWATEKARGRNLLAWAAPIGRMAFTNYLMQSVIFGWLFYGYGLGLFGRLGVAAALAIGIGVYVLQVALSAYWLQRYLYGPVEWLWRGAMYGTWQPLRRCSNAGRQPDAGAREARGAGSL